MAALEARPESFPFAIMQHETMGRSCFATRDIPAGETIAYDVPILLWEGTQVSDCEHARLIRRACDDRIHNVTVNLLVNYAKASREIQQRYDETVKTTSSLEEKRIESYMITWRALASRIWSDCQSLHTGLRSEQNIVDICIRSHLNAHGAGSGHGMFEVGSKFNHSCHPNCTYNQYTKIEGSAGMRIFALRDITCGEQLYTTYIAGFDMLVNTRDRRAILMKEKAFFCRCERCIAIDVLAPLKCPACGEICWRHDEDEYPWHCTNCPRRWWDFEITAQQRKLEDLVVTIDTEMNHGQFRPLHIVRLVLRDCQESLGEGHYLTIRARLLLEEVFAMRQITQIEEEDEYIGRLENVWYYLEYMMQVVWKISPVVASNLSVLRVRTLLGADIRLPAGLPRARLMRYLLKLEDFLRQFWGPEDEDAALIRSAIAMEGQCESCKQQLVSISVCCGCTTTRYCSRQCQVDHREAHSQSCLASVKLMLALRDLR